MSSSRASSVPGSAPTRDRTPRDRGSGRLVELIAAGKALDYPRAREIHDRLLPLTKAVYHRGSHMEGTVALKLGLVARGVLKDATVRPPLRPLADGAAEEIMQALEHAELV